MVDAPECVRGEVGALMERCPFRQLTVQASDHVDRADTMIAGKGFSEPANKPLRLFLGYRCDDGHAPVRPSLANDPVPQKDEAVIDVSDRGFLHIQRQFQLALQKGAAFFADFLCLSFGPFYANIMLHEFDAWLEAKYLSDKARKDRWAWNFGIKLGRPITVRENRQWKPAVAYCRYADDFVVHPRWRL